MNKKPSDPEYISAVFIFDTDATEHVPAGGSLFTDCGYGPWSGSSGCQPAFLSSNIQSLGLSLQGDIREVVDQLSLPLPTSSPSISLYWTSSMIECVIFPGYLSTNHLLDVIISDILLGLFGTFCILFLSPSFVGVL